LIEITSATPALNLGVMFDEKVNFKQHFHHVSLLLFYHIRDLRRIRRCISRFVATTIA